MIILIRYAALVHDTPGVGSVSHVHSAKKMSGNDGLLVDFLDIQIS